MHILIVAIEFAIVLGLLVLIHELGHFIVAKLCGVRVETFSIGFGNRVVGFRYGDTDYRISLIPLGGYVKMAGELAGDGSVLNSEEESTARQAAAAAPPRPDDLTSKPRWQRILIAIAGPVSNFLLSFLLLFIVAHYHHEVDHYLNGPALLDYVPHGTLAAQDGLSAGDTITRFNRIVNPTWEQIYDESVLNLNRPLPITFLHNGQVHSATFTVSVPPDTEFDAGDLMAEGLIPQMDPGPIQVLSVTPNSPASRAGLQPGDDLVSIDNLHPHSVYALLAFLKDNKGATDRLGILRHGQPLTLLATPQKMATPDVGEQYRLGFTYRPPMADIQHLPLGAAIQQSLKDNRDGSMLILRVIRGLFTHHVAVNQMMGPVGIAQQIDLATQMGIWPLLNLVSVISLNLGILNLLPFPLLDGGMIFFLIVESIMRRDVNQRFKEAAYQVAFVCIILFTFFVLFNDISRLHLR
ncbi:MAG: RIP metalloprotease RseP [Acidobacteriaceae bacterium]